MKRVYVDMVADLFHYGHVEFLKKARAMGDYLIVGISADEDLISYKRKPILSTEERAAVVGACRYVDEVLPNAPFRITRSVIEEYKIDLVVHGDDFSTETLEYFYHVPLEMGIFCTVPYTQSISTTEIIRRCKEANANCQ
ncbi:MAG: adenylyltransferase/cytidyltransferase family protein [Chloroflexota bacterium]